MPSIAPLQDARNQDQQDRSNQETQQVGIQGNNVSAEPSQAAAIGPRPPTPAEAIVLEVPFPVVELNAIFDIFENSPLFRSARGRENVVQAARTNAEPQIIVPDIPESQEPIASDPNLEVILEFTFSPEELARARPRRIPTSRAQQIIDYTTSAARQRYSPEEIDNDPRVAEFFRLPVETQVRFITQSLYLLDDFIPRDPLPTHPRPLRTVRREVRREL